MGRPPQNYVHGVFGLLVIALSGYQVNSGYWYEWPKTTGRGDVSPGVNILFWVWMVVRILYNKELPVTFLQILLVAYAAGLSLLPKQYRQEEGAAHKRLAMKETPHRR